MRSLKAQRQQRGSRGKPPRHSGRGTRGQPPSKYARTANAGRSRVSRSLGKLRAWFFFRRPMLLVSLGFVGLAGFAALLVGGTVGRSFHAVSDVADIVMADAGFDISELHIAGQGRTPPQTILAALGLAPGQSIFAADLQTARARLKALPWVADAEVQRRYPDAIYVRIVEKLPFALWQGPDGVDVVERSGGVITNRNLDEFAHLPLLAGIGAPAEGAELIDAVAMHRAVFARVKAMQRQSQRRWNLILDNDVIVKLPESGWQKELDTLEHLIVDKGILERDVAEIDLRSPTHYFFILRGGEKKEIERGNAA